ncbi:MAG: ChbG/HpnK family deacetylase [Planctomycetia bacterium]|nr:ChbG/HpnK family deacetylase [Planctomycetia bacterium]
MTALSSTREPCTIIFNGDDFGLSESVNASMMSVLPCGLLRSISVMVGMPGARAGLESLGQLKVSRSDLVPGLGLHFCLTSGQSVSSPGEIPLLTDVQGRFRHGFLSLLKLLCSPRTKAEAYRQIQIEFTAQASRFRTLLTQQGLTADHIDSHQHIHVLPGITNLLAAEAERAGLLLREPHENYGSVARFLTTAVKRFPGGPAKKMILDSLLARSRTSLPSATCGYFGILDTGHVDTQTVTRILRVIPNLSQRTGLKRFEINLHPWNCRPEDFKSEVYSSADRKFATSAQRLREWNALQARQVYEPFLAKYNLKFGSFSDV